MSHGILTKDCLSLELFRSWERDGLHGGKGVSGSASLLTSLTKKKKKKGKGSGSSEGGRWRDH